jgi:N-acetylglucosaminyldiphosphoundecaprenol N-acetyl-beta-D-mannosaminyltransferase
MISVSLCGIRVHAVTLDAVLDRVAFAAIARRAGARSPSLAVFSANVDMIVKASRNAGFAADLGAGDLVLPDGMPLLWMARCLGEALPERVAGVDLVPAIAARAAHEGLRVFLLGGADGVAARAAERLVASTPSLVVAGTLAPSMGFEAEPRARAEALDAVEAAAPEIVFVGLGAPRQERLILELRETTSAAVLVAVGGAFDMIAGDRPRAPALLQGAGLEWAWRLAQDPQRLARRYLVEDAAIVPLYARALLRRYVTRSEVPRPPDP